MRKLVVPLFGSSIVVGAYLTLSQASPAVDWLSVTALVVGMLVPSIWSAHLCGHRDRVMVCAAFALASILLWDGLAHYVVQKLEPFSMLRNDPWVYVLGGVALSLWTFAIGWVGSLPANPARKA